jgi:hypothetical protein
MQGANKRAGRLPKKPKLATDEPATDEPGTEEPGTEEPGTEEPATEPPTLEPTDEPAITEPNYSQEIGPKYKDEFFEFYERRGVQIRRIWKIFFRLSLPLIRQFRGFLGQIRRILEEYRVDRKRMKKGYILP